MHFHNEVHSLGFVSRATLPVQLPAAEMMSLLKFQNDIKTNH